MKKTLISTFFLFVVLINGFTQQTADFDNPGATYRMAMELYDGGHFASAQKLFNTLLDANNDVAISTIYSDAAYYSAMCAYELHNSDAHGLLTAFLKKYPESNHVRHAHFFMGRLMFRERSYSAALNHFQQTDVYILNKEELAEYRFKTAYSYLKTKEIERARDIFYEIVSKPSAYQDQAIYYYAHLSYLMEDYESALEYFNKIKGNPEYAESAPYYIIHIHYLQGRYEEIPALAEPLLASSNSKNNADIARMAADAYYNNGEYAKALPLLEDFVSKGRFNVSREDWYEIAYTYYQNTRYEDAINAFQKTINPLDTMAQNSFYHLGDCYLKTNQKKFAADAFHSAYTIAAREEITEDALFNYAKIAFELAYDPYNEAIEALRKYVNDFPDSERLDEAKTYLVNLLLSTKNYKEALLVLEEIIDMDENLRDAFQKIAYFRGIEFFNDQKYFDAIGLFKKAQSTPKDKDIEAQCKYWIGESYYRLEEYKLAIEYFKEFLVSPGAYDLDIYHLGNYNLGYSYFKTKDYKSALLYFRKYITAKSNNKQILSDACLRAGDCFFVEKNYNEAIVYYDKAINYNGPDTDYAYFQKAFTIGIKGDLNSKIKVLEKLISTYPQSTYVDDALFQIGTTNTILNNNENALVSFKRLIVEYPKSNLVRKSMLKSGLIYYNNNKYDLALNTMKDVVEKYPGSLESREALGSIKNIYLDMGRVDDYFDYTKSLSFTNISASEQDSLTYIAAENSYMENDCKKAVKGFSSYLSRFEQGAFILNAYFYRAECLFKLGNIDESLSDYLKVLDFPGNNFTETALLKTSAIEYDKKMYVPALKHFKLLNQVAEEKNTVIRSQAGIMRCAYELEDFQEALLIVEDLLSNEKASDALKAEALGIKAHALYHTDSKKEALQAFREALKLANGEAAAEAQYYIALIKYQFVDLTYAEKETFKLINTYGSYDYWVVRGFILLADIYAGQENYFQARQTLQSIIDNASDEGLINIAQQKLEQLKADKVSDINDVNPQDSTKLMHGD